MKIGVFGGTFDPIHYGHLRLAETARESLGLSTVLFVPVGEPVHRDSPPEAGREHRYAMCLLATDGNPAFRVSRVETDNPVAAYTVDTLTALRTELAGADVFLLMGADEAVQFDSWHRPRDIVSVARLAVATRPGLDHETARLAMPDWVADRAEFLPQLSVDISATDIRARVREGRSITYLVPERVAQFIETHGLYRPGSCEKGMG
jgi:nicotinate-nucleotide adenylyltransferase